MTARPCMAGCDSLISSKDGDCGDCPTDYGHDRDCLLPSLPSLVTFMTVIVTLPTPGAGRPGSQRGPAASHGHDPLGSPDADTPTHSKHEGLLPDTDDESIRVPDPNGQPSSDTSPGGGSGSGVHTAATQGSQTTVSSHAAFGSGTASGTLWEVVDRGAQDQQGRSHAAGTDGDRSSEAATAPESAAKAPPAPHSQANSGAQMAQGSIETAGELAEALSMSPAQAVAVLPVEMRILLEKLMEAGLEHEERGEAEQEATAPVPHAVLTGMVGVGVGEPSHAVAGPVVVRGQGVPRDQQRVVESLFPDFMALLHGDVSGMVQRVVLPVMRQVMAHSMSTMAPCCSLLPANASHSSPSDAEPRPMLLSFTSQPIPLAPLVALSSPTSPGCCPPPATRGSTSRPSAPGNPWGRSWPGWRWRRARTSMAAGHEGSQHCTWPCTWDTWPPVRVRVTLTLLFHGLCCLPHSWHVLTLPRAPLPPAPSSPHSLIPPFPAIALLNLRADPNAFDARGYSPLHVLAERFASFPTGCLAVGPAMCRALVHAGARDAPTAGGEGGQGRSARDLLVEVAQEAASEVGRDAMAGGVLAHTVTRAFYPGIAPVLLHRACPMSGTRCLPYSLPRSSPRMGTPGPQTPSPSPLTRCKTRMQLHPPASYPRLVSLSNARASHMTTPLLVSSSPQILQILDGEYPQTELA